MFILNLRDKMRDKRWYRILSFCVLPLYVLFCYSIMEYLNFSSVKKVVALWWRNADKFFFAMTVLCIISGIILLLVKKLWIFAITSGGLSVILGIINCVKLGSNGDYFCPWDITMAGNLGQLTGFARFELPWLLWVMIPLVVIASFLFWLADTEIPLKWYIRVPSAILISLLFVVFYNSPKLTEKTLNKFGMSFENSVLQSSNYKYNGFVNAFTINCFALKVAEPEGYSEHLMTSLLEDCEKTEASNSPDVIVILSEAFYDVRTLKNTTFSRNPLENWDEIIKRDNATTGTLYVTAHGGGTVRTEFEILTGMTLDYLVNGTSPYLYVKNDIETFVSNYKKRGYTTTGIHTYDGKFYMRNVAYPRLGFDKFISQDDIIQNYDVKYRRGYIVDDVFMDAVIDTLEENTDSPNFIFGITMENHGGYDAPNPDDVVIDVENDGMTEEILGSVTTYTQGVYYADIALKKLVDYIDSREKETVLIYYGDHLPALGAYNAAYNQAGNVDISDDYDREELEFIYSTPYLVYSNYDVDYGILETENELSTYYLLPLVSKAIGTEITPYMEYIYKNFELLPYYNVRLGIPLTKEQTEYVKTLELVTYDRVVGKGYTLTK